MRAKDFITEGTEIFIHGDHRHGDNVIAKRTSRGAGKPPAIRMFVTKDEWKGIKDKQANTETMEYDVATAEMIIKDMVKAGGEVIWKTAADWNQDARDIESHRFADMLGGLADQYRGKAKAVSKSELKTIK
jgi:hypothetical protein